MTSLLPASVQRLEKPNPSYFSVSTAARNDQYNNSYLGNKRQNCWEASRKAFIFLIQGGDFAGVVSFPLLSVLAMNRMPEGCLKLQDGGCGNSHREAVLVQHQPIMQDEFVLENCSVLYCL